MRKILVSLFTVLILTTSIFALASCQKTECKINFIIDGEVYASISTDRKKEFQTPNDPMKQGYTFDGWYLDNNTWQIPLLEDSLLDETVSTDLNVYAKWIENKTMYSVSFETNGGTSVENINDIIIQISPETNKADNVFLGWYTNPNLDDSSKVTFPYSLTCDTVLYAKWTPIFTEGLQFSLQQNTNTYAVTGYSGTKNTIEIPIQYNGLPITEISTNAFKSNTQIISVSIPDSVIMIGADAFSECSNLNHVKMSSKLRVLESGAFSNCTKIEHVDLPDTLTTIGEGTFLDCTNLKELYLSNNLTSIGTNIIKGCTSLKKLTMPGSITLSSLVDDVKNIPDSLTDLLIADGSESVCEKMLYGHDNIKYITISSTVTSIGKNAFAGCTSLTSIIVSKDNTSYKFSESALYSKDGKILIQYAIGLSEESVTIPSGVSIISDSAFYECTALKNIFIPSGVTHIGSSSFSECENLLNISIPSTVTDIGDYAFYNCKALKRVSLPKSLINIGDNLFNNCPIEVISMPTTAISHIPKDNLTAITINDGLIIDSHAFYNCADLTSVKITSSTLKSIGSNAFAGCKNIKEIDIPSGVTRIGSYAFAGCEGIMSLKMPDSITNIDSYAFLNCYNLTNLDIPKNIKKIDTGAFYGCYKLIEVYNRSRLEIQKGNDNHGYVGFYALNIYNSMYSTQKTEVDYNGFVFYEDNDICYLIAYVGNETHIQLPNNSNYSIYDYAFRNCKDLVSVKIPNCVTSIGSYAFYGCEKLVNVDISDNVTSIGDYAFSNCQNIQYNEYNNSYYLGNSNNPYLILSCAKNNTITSLQIHENTKFIHSEAFSGCSKIESIIIPDGVKSIGSSAFSGCSNIINVKVPNSVTSVGTSLFYDCSSLESFEIPSGITSITLYMFYNCTNLENVEIPSNITNIAPYAFYNCKNLKNAIIPNSVTRIGTSAFNGCTSLVTISVPFVGETNDALKNIHFGYIFGAESPEYNNTYVPENLKNVLITDSTKISMKAFYNCKNISSIFISNSVKSIAPYAFQDCSKLVTVQLPNSITTIATGLFTGCSSLESVSIPNSVTTIKAYSFYNCSKLKSVSIPNSVTDIGFSSFHGCSELENIVIPNSVKSIGNGAFVYCISLNSVYIPNSVESMGTQVFYTGSETKKIEIYCEASSKPTGWNDTWSCSYESIDGASCFYNNVHWNFKIQ